MRYIPADQEFNSVLECYKLGPLLTDAKRMGGASSNVNFALDTPQGRYFCRVRIGYSEQDALLHRVLIHLTDKGFATPPLLRTANGETYVKYNKRIYELFPFAQGDEFDKGNHEQFAAMGRAIAQFHRCMEDFECSIPFERFAGRGFWNNYPHLQRLHLLYGSKAAMHYDNFEGMLKWLKSHLEHAEWLGRYQMEFEQGLSL